MSNIHSVRLERHVLSGIFQYPEVFSDAQAYLSEKDFYSSVHETIFLIAKQALLNQEKIDKVLIANKIKNLGTTFEDDINIFDYVENLFLSKITKDAAEEACQEISKLYRCRELDKVLQKSRTHIRDNLNDSFSSIASGCDAIYGSQDLTDNIEDKPIQPFIEMKEDLVERGNNPVEEEGIASPYDQFNFFFGGFKPGNLYSIIARPKQGKSTWLNDVCYKTAKINNIKTLILDTEMPTKEVMLRMASARTGVPLWYLSTGQYKNNSEMYEKIVAVWDEFKEDHFYYHYHVRNKTIDEIASLIRRWYYREVGKGNQCVIAYDYVKLTGERLGVNVAEHQMIGQKIDSLKRIAEEIDAPIITALQQNRSGDTFGKDALSIIDDSTTAALSDRINWFSSLVAIFRKKTPEEREMDGEEFGTHKLIPVEIRSLGKASENYQETLRRTVTQEIHGRRVESTRYFKNYINFEVNKFNVEERQGLRQIIDRENEVFNDPNTNPNDLGLL